MEVRYERDPDGRTRLSADIPAEQVDEAFDKALKQVRRHVQVPGFRPGRVPPKMVESIVGTDALVDMAREVLSETVLPGVFEQVPSLVVLDDPEVKEAALTRGAAAEVKIEAMTARVELADYRGIAVERFKSELSTDEARHQLEHRHEHDGQWVPADHEDVRDGDTVYLALRIIRDGYLEEEFDAENPIRVQVGNNSMVPKIDDHLLGLSVGQSSTFEVTYPEDFDNEDLAGKDAEFAIEVVAIATQESFETFALREFEAEDLDTAVEKFREGLASYRDHGYRIDAREKAVKSVVEASTVELPAAFVEADVMEEIEQWEDGLEQRGVDPDSIEDEEREQAEEQIRSEATFSIQRQVVLRAVAQDASLEVSREDLAHEVTMMSTVNRIEPRLMLRRLEEQGMLPQVVRGALIRKAAELVLEHAEVTLVDPPAEAHDHDHEHDHAAPADESAEAETTEEE